MSTQPIPRRRAETRVLVYNPGHLADDVPVMGHFYHFPPRGIGQCTCAHHQPSRPGGQPGDNQGVHAVYDWPRNEKNEMITSGAREVVADAQRVADFIVSEECRGAKGFVILEGSAEEIAEMKRAADRNFVAFYLPQVEQVIANWEASVADYRKNRPGDAAPRQPKVVRNAYEFRDNFGDLLPVTTVRRLPWICNICGNEAENEAALTAVCNRRHPAQTDYTNVAAVDVSPRVISSPRFQGVPRPPAPVVHPSAGPPESEEALRERLGATEEEMRRDAAMGEAGEDDVDLLPGLAQGLAEDVSEEDLRAEGAITDQSPRAAGGPRTPGGSTVPAGILAGITRAARIKAGAEALANAEASKVNLSVADRKGLAHGDADVIADVVERIGAKKGKTKKAPEPES